MFFFFASIEVNGVLKLPRFGTNKTGVANLIHLKAVVCANLIWTLSCFHLRVLGFT